MTTSTNNIVKNALMARGKSAVVNAVKGTDKIGDLAAKRASGDDATDLKTALVGMTVAQAAEENDRTGQISAVRNLDTAVRDIVYDILREYDNGRVTKYSQVTIGSRSKSLAMIYSAMGDYADEIPELMKLVRMKREYEKASADAAALLKKDCSVAAKEMLVAIKSNADAIVRKLKFIQ